MVGQTPKPIYVIFGTDGFLRAQYRAELAAEVIGDADPQICLTQYDASADLAEVLDDLRTLPFLAPRRLVIVTDADEFVSAHRKKLETYLENPATTGSLMLLVKSFPSNTRLAKAVKKIGITADCSARNPQGVMTFIRDYAARLSRKIDRQAVDLLMQWLGNDLARVSSELDKLGLYTEGRPAITVDDIAAVVVATAGVSPWALTDALTAGNARSGLEVLESLLTTRGEEYRVLGLVGWHLRRVLKAKQMQAAGRGEQDIFRTVKVFGRGQSDFRRLLGRRSLQRLGQDFRQLIQTDLAMKTGRDAKAALQRLVVALC